MNTEPAYLAQLRASLEAVHGSEDVADLRQAVELLLRAAITHHETVGLGVPGEEVPAFMETGAPVTIAIPGQGA